MATIKSYTDIEQSKKLAEFLPLESADMYYNSGDACDINFGNGIYKEIANWFSNGKSRPADIPCWSLAALLEQLPYEFCDDDGNSTYLSLNKDDDEYQLIYSDRYGCFDDIETDSYGDFVDACYEMIIRLHELKML